MSRIRILSEHIANQIAAGEVIERPASVVKELLENSLDAGASRITVQVEGNGTSLLRITDNGEGMDADDVLLCLERHATSKLRDHDQLSTLSTLGFRGEALPSIASVARLTILSRPAATATGTRAEVRFGTLHAIHEDGCARGTLIEVRNLFGNVPARRKFLKSPRTELLHIEEVIRNLSLAHLTTGFSLEIDKRAILEVASGSSLEQRTREIFRYQGRLLPLEQSTVTPWALKITGYLLPPDGVPPGKNQLLRTMVNGRPVQDRTLRHAVQEGFRNFMLKGLQPAGVLLLELPAAEVDINVHPAKREVRFRDPKSIGQFLTRAVSRAVQEYQEGMRTEIFTPRSPAPPEPSLPVGEKHSAIPPLQQLRLNEASIAKASPPVPPTAAPAARPTPAAAQPHSPSSYAELADCAAGPAPCRTAEPEHLGGITLIGQLFQLYLLGEQDGQLVLIDQHAAHERILYQQLRQGYLQRSLPGQELLFPVTVELAPEDAETLEEHGEDISSLGLTVHHFGDTTWMITAVPALITQLPPAEILREILTTLRSRSRSGEPAAIIPPALDGLLASLACKGAIKAGNRLAPKEMVELLGRMQQAEIFSHCPHGRPVLKFIEKKEIEKWFQRS